MTAAVLALQGAFAEHEQVFRRLGVDCFELRGPADLDRPFDALILPGGESTVQSKLLRELGMFGRLQAMIREGLPVFATCAGMILLAGQIEADPGDKVPETFGTLPMTVRRNAYGRQLGSFRTRAEVKGVGEVPMTFIRAPYVVSVGETPSNTGDIPEILAVVDGRIAAVRCGNQYAFAFHPELDEDRRLQEYFLESVAAHIARTA
ncbi:MAG: pyridoxal 5'-phosphate synthase glutaminase subunit PdxT [Lachnospiraceae bacterium]|nr:pyridoxal 5'-phosphate synthase glutaminase subunit PdxT [Lachnospiraceae bacterium]